MKISLSLLLLQPSLKLSPLHTKSHRAWAVVVWGTEESSEAMSSSQVLLSSPYPTSEGVRTQHLLKPLSCICCPGWKLAQLTLQDWLCCGRYTVSVPRPWPTSPETAGASIKVWDEETLWEMAMGLSTYPFLPGHYPATWKRTLNRESGGWTG